MVALYYQNFVWFYYMILEKDSKFWKGDVPMQLLFEKNLSAVVPSGSIVS